MGYGVDIECVCTRACTRVRCISVCTLSSELGVALGCTGGVRGVPECIQMLFAALRIVRDCQG